MTRRTGPTVGPADPDEGRNESARPAGPGSSNGNPPRIHGQDTAPAAPGPSPAGETFDDFDDSTAVVPLPWPTFANWPEIIPSGGGPPRMARPGVDFDAVNTPGFVVVGRCG